MEQSTVTTPVRASVSVRASQERAFEVFTKGLGSWWPLATHSIEADKIVTVEMECRAGGRVVERHRDGGQADWGEVTLWEPPARVAFTWNPTYEDRPHTEVEVTFTEETSGVTRVDLEHRGWERLGDRGKELRDGYVSGWAYIMESCFGRSLS